MKIAFLGDIALIGKYDISQQGEENVIARLQEVKSLLREFDYIVANLESPLTDIVVTHEYKSMPLRTAKSSIKVLEYLGINAVSLANNHVYDFGNTGLDECIELLDQHKIAHFGIGQEPLLLDVYGERISIQGFCCYTANGWHYNADSNKGKLNTLTLDNIELFLSKSHKNGSYPIIVPHWGDENTHYPRSEHVFLAKTVLEHISCSIVGGHPHVSQGILKEQNGLCAFSLGNFIFDDCYCAKNGVSVIQTDDNKHGFILGLEIVNGKLISSKVIPYFDSDVGMKYCSDGIETIENYSNFISALYGKNEYESVRSDEQQKAQVLRLGKRDVKWFINHLNCNSVMTVLQRRNNQRNFTRVVDSICEYSGNDSFFANVLYVGNFGLPDTNAAGKRVFANSLLIEKCGYDVLMVGCDPAVRGRIERITDRISYTSFPQYGKSTGKKYFDWLKMKIEKNGSKPAMIIRYGSPGLAIFDKYLFSYCHKQGIPIVVDVVDWLCVDSGNLLFKIVKGTDTYLEKNIFNKRGDGLITISSYLNDFYKGYYQNIITIPPLVENYTSKSYSNHIPQIVYAGNPFRKGELVRNLHSIKDRLDITVNVFISLEKKGIKFDFHVIGMSCDEYVIAFPNMREILNSVEHIHFHGRQSMERTQNMISTMDYSILLRERTRGTMAGFPTKVVESMSLGVPVITTDTSDLKQYIQDLKTGFFVDISDQQVLEEQLIRIINTDQDSLKKVKTKICEDKVFAIDNYEFQFKEFIRKLMERQLIGNRE